MHFFTLLAYTIYLLFTMFNSFIRRKIVTPNGLNFKNIKRQDRIVSKLC